MTTSSTTREPAEAATAWSPGDVLAVAREGRRATDAAEAQVLAAAAAWADLHPAESINTAHCFAETAFSERPVLVAGPGAPLVAEFAIPEFAASIGVKTEWGGQLIGEALELRHRLPRLWARVMDGDLSAWRGRRLARATIAAGLSVEAAAYVDRHVAHCAHTLGPVQTDRLVEEAIARFMPEQHATRARQTADGRRFDVHTSAAARPGDPASGTGTVHVDGVLDLADALDLDAALTARAAELKAAGSNESLDVRRSIAVGDLARADQPLGFDDQDPDQDPDPALGFETGAGRPPQPAGRHQVRRQVGRQVVLYVHLSQAALTGRDTGHDTGRGAGHHLARVENGGGHLGHLVTADQVRAWCAGAAKITIKPVLDLAEATPVTAYEIPDRMRDQVILRDPTCVFPHCTRPARGCDLDHIEPYDPNGPPTGGGQTGPANLLPR